MRFMKRYKHTCFGSSDKQTELKVLLKCEKANDKLEK